MMRTAPHGSCVFWHRIPQLAPRCKAAAPRAAAAPLQPRCAAAPPPAASTVAKTPRRQKETQAKQSLQSPQQPRTQPTGASDLLQTVALVAQLVVPSGSLTL